MLTIYFILIPNQISFKLNFYKKSKIIFEIKKRFDSFISEELKTKKFLEIDLFDKNLDKIDDRFLIFSREDFKIFFDKKKYFAQIEDNIFSFDSLLRVISSLVLIENNGIFLHSCSILKNGNKAVLYVGPSGAGKSTIAKKYRYVLTDELSIVVLNKKNLYVYKSPFWGELEHLNYKKVFNKSFIVDKIYFLSGFSDKSKIESLTFKEKIELFFKNLFWVVKGKNYNNKIFDVVFSIAKLVPCYKFYPTYEIQN